MNNQYPEPSIWLVFELDQGSMKVIGEFKSKKEATDLAEELNKTSAFGTSSFGVASDI